MKRISRYPMAVLACSLLLISTVALALTDEERLRLLQDRFIKSEISEKAYYELKADLEKRLSKSPEQHQVIEVKPVQVIRGNLVKNGSFEEDANGDFVPDSWAKWGTKGVEVVWDNETFHSGKYALKQTAATKVQYSGSNQLVAVTGGKSYRFTMWAKGGEDLKYYQVDSGPVVMFGWKDSNNKDIGWSGGSRFIEKGRQLKANPEWQKLEAQLTAPANAAKLSIATYLYECSGSVWWDDASLEIAE